LVYKVVKLVLSISSTAPQMGLYKGKVSLPFTVSGAGAKLVRFYLDEREFHTETVATSGISREAVLPQLTDGAHILEIQAEVTSGIETMKSNRLQLGILYHSSTMTT
jgi:hypothetical protein